MEFFIDICAWLKVRVLFFLGLFQIMYNSDVPNVFRSEFHGSQRETSFHVELGFMLFSLSLNFSTHIFTQISNRWFKATVFFPNVGGHFSLNFRVTWTHHPKRGHLGFLLVFSTSRLPWTELPWLRKPPSPKHAKWMGCRRGGEKTQASRWCQHVWW